MPRYFAAAVASLFLAPLATTLPPASAADDAALAGAIGKLAPNVLPADQKEAARGMIGEQQRGRFREANARSTAEWRKLASKEEWEAYRKEKLAALARSVGPRAAQTEVKAIHVSGKLEGDGYRIENILFTGDGQDWVSGNLYLPAKPVASPPGFVICHSHHTAKTHGELQDMGMTWARQGCAVLVIDHLGYGDRVLYPWTKAEDYPAATFQLGRQSYYFRYDSSLELSLLGESLIGWMAGDLRKAATVLLTHAKCDPRKIILLGSVAGGGDPTAVAGALDERFTCVGPFNFGGPQPETRFPLPDNAEESFNYSGSGGWESTRNLAGSAAGGFLPWVIVGGIAPRRLIYGHEFSWDEPRDPVWKRLTQIYKWYGVPENQAVAHGRGLLSGKEPEATHCGHIGREHRKMIHPALAKWFDIQVSQEQEYSQRRPAAELRCLTDAARGELKPRPFNETIHKRAVAQLAVQDEKLRDLAGYKKLWAGILGPIDPPVKVAVEGEAKAEMVGTVEVQRLVLSPEPGIRLPIVRISPAAKVRNESLPSPCVVAFAQGGKAGFLAERSEPIAKLVDAGVVVCLVDLRGTGETSAGSDRDQYSAATAHSSSELMLGGTLVGARLRDLRSVLVWLRTQKEIDPQKIALWGDSFAPVNSPETNFAAPRRIDSRPRVSEPLGQLLCLLAPLYEPDLKAVYFAGGLTSFASILESPFVYVPHDCFVPGMLNLGDVKHLASVAPCPVGAGRFVDAYNRTAKGELGLSEPAAWLASKLK